jgi:Fe-S-cluster containining protein
MKEFNCLESCPDLGSCCREFALIYNGLVIGEGKKRASQAELLDLMKSHNWPFLPSRYDLLSRRWFFTCPKLGIDGKCMIYEERPSVCRNFKPKTDKYLCCVRMTLGETIIFILNFFRKVLTFTR